MSDKRWCYILKLRAEGSSKLVALVSVSDTKEGLLTGLRGGLPNEIPGDQIQFVLKNLTFKKAPLESVGVLIVGGKWFVRLERKGEFCFAEIKAPELTKRVARKCSVCNKGGALVDVYALSQKFVLCSQCQLKPNESEQDESEEASEQDESEEASEQDDSDEAYSETEGAGKRKRVRDAAQDLGGDSEPDLDRDAAQDLDRDAAQDLGGDSEPDLDRDSEPRLVGNPTLPRKRKQKPKPLFARDSGFTVLNEPPDRFKEKPKKIKFSGRLGGGELPANLGELYARRIAKFG